MQLRRHLLTLRLACATAMMLLVAGCGTQPATSTSPTPGASPTASFNDTDIAWIQLMIPMDERALLLTDLAPSRAADTAVTALAAGTGSRLRAELRDLRELLKLSGAPDTRPHEGHTMPGMVPLDTIERARDMTGAGFEQILTEALRAHLTQSRTLCTGERAQGRAGKAKELAADIADAAADQLTRLDDLRPARTAPPKR
ncbi:MULTISPECIES: DUF305 domain-containing protein [unclassified Streptomyces]|uniref:DUF305 domain-containing protein n=1 Tax=unclassified Streptomyces TaxID=2593676 RepID=UPI0036F0BF10